MAGKKIVFVLTSLRKGGAEGKALKLITALRNHHEVALLVFNNAIDYDLPANVKVHLLGSRLKLLRETWLQLPLIFLKYWFYMRREKIQVTFSYGYMPNILCLINKRFNRYGKVIINHINNSDLELKKDSGFKANLRGLLISKYYERVDRVVVPSRGLKEDLIKNTGVGSDKIKLIYNPLDLATIDVLSAEPISFNQGNSAAFTFIHVGNFRPQKNHRLLLRSFASMANKQSVLWLLGHGTDDESLKAMARELGVADRVFHFGMVQNPYACMKRADCLVLSSDFEGLPNVILEALACELPVVSTDCSFGPREILAPTTNYGSNSSAAIETAEYGVLVPVKHQALLSEAMDMAVKKSEGVIKPGDKLRKRAGDFDIKIILTQYLDLIDRM